MDSKNLPSMRNLLSLSSQRLDSSSPGCKEYKLKMQIRTSSVSRFLLDKGYHEMILEDNNTLEGMHFHSMFPYQSGNSNLRNSQR